jgi:hypothetical protein
MKRKEWCGPHSNKRKNMISPNEKLETLLMQRFQQMRSENILINIPALWEKAMQVTLRLQIDNSRVSKGWLVRLKTCHVISCRFICGESSSAN